MARRCDNHSSKRMSLRVIVVLFGDCFDRSGMWSIDAFLAHRDEFTEPGKLAIAAVIADCERKAKPPRPRPIEAFRQNRLSIITFNYDRSLEFFLRDAIQHSYGLSVSDASRWTPAANGTQYLRP